MTEESSYLTTVDPPIYLRWHEPVGVARGVVVVCGPFAEEKKAAQRSLVEAARAFAAAGLGVLRLDYRGTGDSGGEFGEFDLESRVEDIGAAARWALGRCPGVPLTLLGLRLGGALAHLAAIDLGGIESLALWEPVVVGATYLEQNRRRSAVRTELTGGETAAAGVEAELWDFDGFAVNARLQEQLRRLDLRALPAPARRALVLQISGSAKIKKPLQDLADRLGSLGVATKLESVAVESFWSAIGWVDTTAARGLTLAWLCGESEP